MKTAPGSVEMLVRMKPYNPQRGNKKRRHHTFFGANFSEERGWCRMPSKIMVDGRVFDVEDYLRNVRENDDELCPLVFDVCTIKEAQLIEKKEKDERNKRRSADKADSIGGVNNPVEMRAPSRDEESEDAEVAKPEPTPARKPRRARVVATT